MSVTRRSAPARGAARARPSSPTTCCETAASCALAPSVFASRTISCSRKSSRLPTGSRAPARARPRTDRGGCARRVSSSVTSLRSARSATSASSRAVIERELGAREQTLEAIAKPALRRVRAAPSPRDETVSSRRRSASATRGEIREQRVALGAAHRVHGRDRASIARPNAVTNGRRAPAPPEARTDRARRRAARAAARRRARARRAARASAEKPIGARALSSVAGASSGAFGAHDELDATAPQPLAHDLLGEEREIGELARQPRAHVEEALVDRADLGDHAPFAEGDVADAEARHAPHRLARLRRPRSGSQPRCSSRSIRAALRAWTAPGERRRAGPPPQALRPGAPRGTRSSARGRLPSAPSGS